MSEEDLQALTAAKLYAEEDTFQTIADKIDVSKSFAQHLVRRGIAISMEAEKSETGELTHENPSAHQNGGNPLNVETPQFPFPQDPRIGFYTLETTGIGRRVMLTPKALMIYDIWKGDGFEGDLSDFLEKSVQYLYNTRRPTERSFDL